MPLPVTDEHIKRMKLSGYTQLRDAGERIQIALGLWETARNAARKPGVEFQRISQFSFEECVQDTRGIIYLLRDLVGE